MTTLARLRFEWSGIPVVGGGVSTFYTTNLSPLTFTTAVRSFFNSVSGLFPSGVVITAPASGDLITAETGALAGAWAQTPPAPVLAAGGTTAWAAGVGCAVVWNTAGMTRRRRVKGRTYLLPAMASTYQSDGSIADSNLALIQTAANTLIAADSASMRIWTRPLTTESGDGAAHPVVAATVPDRVTWLRSRRT
jgi:hypothetical protein